MSVPPPEMPRPFPAERVGAQPRAQRVEATAAERVRLAERLGLPEVMALAAQFTLTRGSDAARGEIIAEATLTARVMRECVVSLEPFAADIAQAFRLRFVRAGTERDDDPEDDDEVPYADGVIDLGEAAVEQLALDLDPYPRKPDAELPPEASAPERGPFARLGERVKRT